MNVKRLGVRYMDLLQCTLVILTLKGHFYTPCRTENKSFYYFNIYFLFAIYFLLVWHKWGTFLVNVQHINTKLITLMIMLSYSLNVCAADLTINKTLTETETFKFKYDCLNGPFCSFNNLINFK